MITNFKKYGKLITESLESDLSDYLDDEVIEKYYSKHYAYDDIRDVMDIMGPMVWDHIDDERYLEDWAEGEKQREIDEFNNEDEFISYIEGNLTDIKMKKALEFYNEDNDEETEYGNYMLSDLSEDQLRDIIKEDDEEWDFVSDTIDVRRNDYSDARGIIEDMYGSVESMDGKEIIEWVGNYINDDELIQAYNDGEELEHKRETIESNIEDTIELQENILEEDNNSVIELAELFVKKREKRGTDDNDDIGDEYNFQKIYVKKFVEQDGQDDSVAVALKYLYDNFGLNSDLEDEHDDDDMVLITIDKYNL